MFRGRPFGAPGARRRSPELSLSPIGYVPHVAEARASAVRVRGRSNRARRAAHRRRWTGAGNAEPSRDCSKCAGGPLSTSPGLQDRLGVDGLDLHLEALAIDIDHGVVGLVG